jgi:cobalt-zinc-cadmium efflux system protein
VGAHDEHAAAPATRLAAATGLNVAFAVVQVIVGVVIGSVVVLADAAHQAVDALGLITALVALTVARRPSTHEWTFGFGKADALGGLVSALLLVGSVVWIVVESVRRLVDPEEVSGLGVLTIGLVAIAVNGLGVLLVGHGHGDEAVSLRAARLHLVTDLAGSVIVVIAGAILALGGPAWIDPVASLMLSAAVLWSTWGILRTSTGVLLDRAPERLTTGDVEALLRDQPGVSRVHHLHVRPLGGGNLSVTAHVVVDGERSVHDAQQTLDDLNSVLLAEHGVAHATLQLECHECGEDDCG